MLFRSTYVGDKIPRLYERYQDLALAFPSARVVFMTRNLVDVAKSWKARANDSDDTLWPPSMDVNEAIRQWNESHHTTLAAIDEMDIFVLRFEKLFELGDISPLFDFLDLEVTDGTQKWWGWTRARYLERRAGDGDDNGRAALSWLESSRIARAGDIQARETLIQMAASRGRLI